MKTTTMVAGLLVVAMTAFGAGCSAPVGGADDANGTGTQAGTGANGGDGANGGTPAGGNPATGPNGTTPGAVAGGTVDANTRYVPEQDQAKAQEIVVRMWTQLTTVGCWYMKGSTNNYSFSGANNYRYAGYETTAGQVTPVSAGTFGGYDMAEVMINGTTYWVGIADAQNMAMSSVFNGKLITNWYTASDRCI